MRSVRKKMTTKTKKPARKKKSLTLSAKAGSKSTGNSISKVIPRVLETTTHKSASIGYPIVDNLKQKVMKGTKSVGLGMGILGKRFQNIGYGATGKRIERLGNKIEYFSS